MASIPIQDLNTLAAVYITGNENIPLVQTAGSDYYTYKTPIKNLILNSSVPPSALSSSPLTWTRNSNVGVGTLSPSAKLHVVGTPGDTIPDFRIGSGFGTVSGSIDFYNNLPSGSYNGIVNAGDHAIIYGRTAIDTANSLAIAPWASNTSGIRINSTGNVGIGTSSPATRLDVAGSITLSQNNNSIRFTDQNGSQPNFTMQSDNNFVFNGTNSAGGTRPIFNIFQRNSTSSFAFSVGVTAPTFTSTSSKRFKTDINNLTNSLESINKLQGVTFKWKETGKPDIGLIAEEVNDILPDLVTKNDSNIPEGIDYGKLTAVLVESIKELTQKVQKLESKLT